jgi:hypothetical protein
VHILRSVTEKSAEWGECLWLATLDVEKAFDRVHHSCLFDALLKGGVHANTVSALRRLYTGLCASVSVEGGQVSRWISIQRGVRQGDPLSPLLFNLVMKDVLQEVQTIWQRRGYGTNVGQDVCGRRLTHVAFADDVTLVSRSWLSMKRMLISLRAAMASRGLSLHPSKCKAQTNDSDWQRRGKISLADGFSINILEAGESLELLGTMLNLEESTGYEITHRIASAWRVFWRLKSLLLNRRASLRRRLRLFDATVGGSVCWCCESWAPKCAELRQVEVVQRSMLRKIVGMRRDTEETWVDWICRTTRKTLAIAVNFGVRNWKNNHLRSKWLWAGHVARSDPRGWLHLASFWRGRSWQIINYDMGSYRLLRPSNSRRVRWEDPIFQYRKDWEALAPDRLEWSTMVDAFVRASA